MNVDKNEKWDLKARKYQSYSCWCTWITVQSVTSLQPLKLEQGQTYIPLQLHWPKPHLGTGSFIYSCGISNPLYLRTKQPSPFTTDFSRCPTQVFVTRWEKSFSADESEQSSPTTYLFIVFQTSSHMLLKQATWIGFLRWAQKLCTTEASLRFWLLSLHKRAPLEQKPKEPGLHMCTTPEQACLRKSLQISNCMSKTYPMGLTEQPTTANRARNHISSSKSMP